MAVDTRQKRFSMLNFGDGTSIHALTEADGSSGDADDRQQFLDCYSGIAFGAADPTTAMNRSRSVSRFVASRVFGRVN